LISIYPGCGIAFGCLVYTTSKHLSHVVRDYSFNSTHMSCNLIYFGWIFCNDSEAILSRISTLCPGGQAFPSKTHLKEVTNYIHLVKII